MPADGSRRRALVVLVSGWVVACAQVAPAPVFVTGTATYRERMALPPQAVFEASVVDIARADAASAVLASVRVESPQVPVRFSIPVDPAHLQPGGRYALRARITLDGRLMFTSDTVHPVLGAAGTTHADVLLRRVAAADGHGLLGGRAGVAARAAPGDLR